MRDVMQNYGWILLVLWGLVGITQLLIQYVKWMSDKQILETKLKVAAAKMEAESARKEAAKLESQYWRIRSQKLAEK